MSIYKSNVKSAIEDNTKSHNLGKYYLKGDIVQIEKFSVAEVSDSNYGPY